MILGNRLASADSMAKDATAPLWQRTRSSGEASDQTRNANQERSSQRCKTESVSVLDSLSTQG